MQNLINSNSIRTEFSVKNEWDNGFTGRLDIFNTGELVEDWTIEFESAFEIEPGEIWGAEIVNREGNIYTLKPLEENQIINSEREVSIFFNANKVNGEVVSPTNILLNSNVDSVSAPQADESDVDLSVDSNDVSEEIIEETILEPIETEINDSTESTVLEPAVEAETTENDSTESTATETSATESAAESNDIDAQVNFTLVKDWGSGFEGEISITNNTGGNIDSWDLEFDFPNQIDNIWDAEIEENADGSYVITHTNWNREIAAGETITFGFTGSDSVTSEPQNFDLDGSVFSSASRSDSIYTYSNDDLQPELELDREYQGRATFYDAANPAGGLGASGYDIPTQSELHKIVAINNIQWNGSEASGAFFEVSGPKQRDGAAPITVQVVDYLYERADGFDMSAEAFAKVADPVDGIVNIEYQMVGPDDDYVTAYGYSIRQGIVVEGIDHTSPYYAAVRLNNHRYPIESVELVTDGDDLVELERESDNRFVLNGNYPLYGGQDLVVTDIFGQQLTLNDIDITNGSSADVVTGEQFELI